MDYGGDHEFSASQRAFVVEHKLAGRKYPSISRRFQEKYGIEAPTRRHVYNLVKKLKTKGYQISQREIIFPIFSISRVVSKVASSCC